MVKKNVEQEDFNKTELGEHQELDHNLPDIFTDVESVETTQNGTAESVIGKKNNKYLIACVIGCAIAFFILVLCEFIAGGSAVNGKIESGKFYMGTHGVYTEVSRLVYILSATNTFILGVLIPLATYALCFSISGKTEDTKMPSKRFGLVFVVFSAFVGGNLALTSLMDCILTALTVS